jgi:putative membrane protein
MKKLNFLKVLCSVMFVALILQSCKSDEDKGANYQMENQVFVTQAMSSNKFEVAAGTLAQAKATNAQIKQFGANMMSAHTAVGIDLTDLAKSMELVVPANMETEDQNNINVLGLLTGNAFEQEFVRMMVESHQKAITLYQKASGNTGVPAADLRQFADIKVPALQQHLKEAQSLQVTLP